MTITDASENRAQANRLAVLLVEDNPSDALLTRRALEKVPGLAFDIAVADTIAEAVSAVSTSRPDVVLLDLELPDATGVSGVQTLLNVAPHAVVVVLTGHDDDAVGQQAVQLGVQDYLRKGDLHQGKLGQAIEYAVYRAALTAELQESEERFSGLFREAPVAMRLIGLDGRIVDINDAFGRVSGYAASDLVGRVSTCVVHPEDAAAASDAVVELVDGGKASVTYEERLLRSDGEIRHLRVSAGLVRSREGTPTHISNVCEDITEQRLAQAQVAFQARLLDSVGQAVVAVDASGALTYFNRAAEAMFGLTAAQLGQPARQVVNIFEAAPGVRELALTDTAGNTFHGLAATTQSHVGRTDEDTIAVVTDIDGIKRAELLLARSEARLRSLVENISDVISLHDADGTCRYLSPSGVRLLGLSPESRSLLDDVMESVHPDDRPVIRRAFERWRDGRTDQVHYRVRTGDGSWLHCESVGHNLLLDPAVEAIVVTTRDITERKRTEAALAHQALHDALTGLPNRTLFVDRLNLALARAPRLGSRVAVLFLDLDNFKLINDSFGHRAGDEVLSAVAELLESAMRPGDTIARLGGDEFGVVCEGIKDVADAEAFAERLGATLRSRFGVSGQQIHVTTSIGIALSDEHRCRAEDLLQDADVALYRAKDSGRARAAVYDDELKARARRRLTVEDALRVALERDELSLHFQPQVALANGKLMGFEALVRWTHPELGEVSPDEFIPVLEQTDLIVPVGRWVLEQSVRRMADWRRRIADWHVSVSVNLSARQMADCNLPEVLADILRDAEMDASALCLELTESAVMDDAETSVCTLRALKRLGVTLAIDDFGTGYSSLAYLKRFPVDFLKVDRTFVNGLGRDPEDTVIVASVVDLGRSLGLDVVAEGVETETQLDELSALGCSFGQGFYWSRPLPPDGVEELLTKVQRDGGVISPPRAGAVRERRPTSDDRDDVVATLAHELRTPITVIRGFAETMGELIRAGRTDVLENALEAINRQTQGMEHVLSSLADARAVDAGTLVLEAATVDLGELIREITTDAAAGLSESPLVVDVLSSDEVTVDRNRVRQVISNLLTNAAKHSPAGAPIDVVVEADTAEARVRVIDRGPGIAPARVGELFRKFSRLDRRTKGTGLGLFLARTLARAHGGDVVYRRAATGGAEFVLLLPLANGSGQAGSAARVETPAVAAVPYRRRMDDGTLTAAYDATRAVFQAVVPEQVVGAAIDLVSDLGGRITSAEATAGALPLDLSLGHGDPLFALAEPVSVTRSRLDHALPLLLEDAARALEALRERADKPRSTAIDAVTGLPRSKMLTGAEGNGLAVVLVHVDGYAEFVADVGRTEAVRVIRALGRAARVAVRPWGHAARSGEGVLLWGEESSASTTQTIERLTTAWQALRPHPLTISTGVATSSDGGVNLLRAARRAVTVNQALQISRNR